MPKKWWLVFAVLLILINVMLMGNRLWFGHNDMVSPETSTGSTEPVEPVTDVPTRAKPADYVYVFGKAVGPTGKPMSDCLVSIGEKGSQWVDFCSVDEDGSYRGFGPPGRVEVSFFMKWPDTPKSPRADLVHREVVFLPKEGEFELNIKSKKDPPTHPLTK